MTLPVRLPLAMRSRSNIYFYLQQFIGPPVAYPSPRVHLPKISPLYTPLRLPISPLSLSPSDPLHLLQRQARNTGDMRQNTGDKHKGREKEALVEHIQANADSDGSRENLEKMKDRKSVV